MLGGSRDHEVSLGQIFVGLTRKLIPIAFSLLALVTAAHADPVVIIGDWSPIPDEPQPTPIVFPGSINLSTLGGSQFSEWVWTLYGPDGAWRTYSSASPIDNGIASWGQQVSNSNDSIWMGLHFNGYAYYYGSSVLTYRRSFSLDGAQLETASLSGTWAAAGPSYYLNSPVDLTINGVVISQTESLFPSEMTAFNVPNALFLAGENVLSISFSIDPADVNTPSTAFAQAIVRFEGILTATPNVAAVPLPAPIGIFALALFGLLASSRSKDAAGASRIRRGA